MFRAASRTTGPLSASERGRKPFYSTVKPQIFNGESSEGRVAGAAALRTAGFCVMRLLDDQQCEEQIMSASQNLLIPSIVNTFKPEHTEFLKTAPDPATDPRGFYNWITKPKWTSNQRKLLETVWPFHRQFGACADGASWHTPKLWDVRTGYAADFAALALPQHERIWVDINRTIMKLPGQGEDELCHWDINPWNPLLADPNRIIQPNAVCGKVVFSDSSFICAPETHTPEFFGKFQREYGGIYRTQAENPNLVKFGLDVNKADPLNLMGDLGSGTPSSHVFRFEVPKGCGVFWASDMLHATEKSDINGHIEFGMYLGYMKAQNRPEYAEAATKLLQKHFGPGNEIDELYDRLSSFFQGARMVLYPSLDPTWTAPRKQMNFPKQVWAKMDLMTEEAKVRLVKYRKVHEKDTPYFHDDYLGPSDYQCPPMTPRLEQLLIDGLPTAREADFMDVA